MNYFPSTDVCVYLNSRLQVISTYRTRSSRILPTSTLCLQTEKEQVEDMAPSLHFGDLDVIFRVMPSDPESAASHVMRSTVGLKANKATSRCMHSTTRRGSEV